MGVNNECRQQIELLAKILFPETGHNMDATDVGIETLELIDRLKALVTELEKFIQLGYPADAIEGCPPEDGRRYRVFFASRIVCWEAGPNVWNSNGDSAAWYANNADCYLLESK